MDAKSSGERSRAGTGRGFRRTAALFCLVALGTLAPLPAQAQERSRSFLDMLFGGPPVRRLQPYDYDRPILREAPPARRQAPTSVRKPKATTASPAAKAALPASPVASAPPAPVEIVKSETARKVLVVGDFLAASLSGALTASFAENPNVIVVDRANGSSGFVRDDHYDWVASIGALLDAEKPAALVVMIGSNDRQSIAEPDGPLALRTDPWMAEYERRLDAFTATVKQKNVPLVWVGMPSFKSERMSDDVAAFNEMYKAAASDAEGQYVDVWDGFVDANGAFAFSGPDIAGQQARLRNSDGITMTAQGREKLAFFAQKPLFKLLGTTGEGLETPAAGPALVNAAETAPASASIAAITAIAAMSLSDPALDGGEDLLGRPATAVRPDETSHREKLVVTGTPVSGPSGRADDFDWNAKTSAVAPLRPSEQIISRGSLDLGSIIKPAEVRPPEPMPSLQDAILDDWARQNARDQAREKAGKGAVPASPPPSADADRG